MLTSCQTSIDGSIRMVMTEVEQGQTLAQICNQLSNENGWNVTDVCVLINGQTMAININDPFTQQFTYLFSGSSEPMAYVEYGDVLSVQAGTNEESQSDANDLSSVASQPTPGADTRLTLNDLELPHDDMFVAARYRKTKFSQWVTRNSTVFNAVFDEIGLGVLQFPTKSPIDLNATLASHELGKALTCLYQDITHIPNEFVDTARFAWGNLWRSVLDDIYKEEGFVPADAVTYLSHALAQIGIVFDKSLETYLKQSIRTCRYSANLKKAKRQTVPIAAVRVAVDPPPAAPYARRGLAPLKKLSPDELTELFYKMANLPGLDKQSVVAAFSSSTSDRVQYILTEDNMTPHDFIIKCPGYVQFPLATLRIDYQTRCSFLRETEVNFQSILRDKLANLYEMCKADGCVATESLSIDVRMMVVFEYIPQLILNNQKRFRVNKPAPFVFHTDCISYEAGLADIKEKHSVKTAFIGVSKVSQTMTNFFVNFADFAFPAETFADALEIFYKCHYVFHVRYEPSIFIVLTLLDRIFGLPGDVYQTIEKIVSQL